MSEAANLLSKLTQNDRAVKTLRATVSSYREDGTVNLSYGTSRMYGIPCLASYTARAIGDVVQVLDLGNSVWVVLGRIGGTDSGFVGPAAQNSGYQQYYLDTLTSRGTTDIGYEGYIGSSGADKERPLMLAWSYYNGFANTMNLAFSPKTSATVYVARSNRLHGQREAVEMRLCPHNYNTLPSTITLDTASFSPVNFRLEVGEVRAIPLPADWFAAAAAGTPTIKGFAVQPITVSPSTSGYAIFSPTSGGYRTF
jgi:hypothetical protein